LTPEIYAKIKRPIEDTLYVLGVKDVDTYLPTDDEVVKMIEQGKAAMGEKEPTPAEKKDLSAAALNTAKAQQIQMETTGEDAETKLDMMAIALGKPKVYS
jgi:hypothetical protein